MTKENFTMSTKSISQMATELLAEGFKDLDTEILPPVEGEHETGYNTTNPRLSHYPKVRYTLPSGSEVILTIDEHLSCVIVLTNEEYGNMGFDELMDKYLRPIISDFVSVAKEFVRNCVVFARMPQKTNQSTSEVDGVCLRVSPEYVEHLEVTRIRIEVLFATFV